MGYVRQPAALSGEPRVPRIRFVLWAVLGLNLLVAVMKIVWGAVSGSVAMQADGIHSLFDGTSNVVGLLGMAVAGRPADRDHPYGHGKFETYASAVIGGMLVAAAWRVGSGAIGELMNPGDAPEVTMTSFGVMIGTLAVNLGVTMWERREGKRLGSEILIADASHTSSDAIVSIGVILGLIAVRMGYPMADPIIALFIALAIVYTAWGVFKRASATLSDSSRIPSGDVCQVALEIEGVLGCHHIRTRGSESHVYVDLHIQVDPSATVAAGHAVAEAVERSICDHFPQAADVIVHLEPLDDYQVTKTAQEQRDASS